MIEEMIGRILMYRLSFPKILPVSYCFSTTPKKFGLNDFFDDPKNWSETSIYCGRPWRKEELRLKSNVDLHKLWYILLKERNMLMTMEQEYNRRLERLPKPERFEKVEESMENLLMVVEERNRVNDELEHGEWIGPKVVQTVDELGREVSALTSEHSKPRVTNKEAIADEAMWSNKTIELLRLAREKVIQGRRENKRRARYESTHERWEKIDYLDETAVEKWKI